MSLFFYDNISTQILVFHSQEIYLSYTPEELSFPEVILHLSGFSESLILQDEERWKTISRSDHLNISLPSQPLVLFFERFILFGVIREMVERGSGSFFDLDFNSNIAFNYLDLEEDSISNSPYNSSFTMSGNKNPSSIENDKQLKQNIFNLHTISLSSLSSYCKHTIPPPTSTRKILFISSQFDNITIERDLIPFWKDSYDFPIQMEYSNLEFHSHSPHSVCHIFPNVVSADLIVIGKSILLTNPLFPFLMRSNFTNSLTHLPSGLIVVEDTQKVNIQSELFLIKVFKGLGIKTQQFNQDIKQIKKGWNKIIERVRRKIQISISYFR